MNVFCRLPSRLLNYSVAATSQRTTRSLSRLGLANNICNGFLKPRVGLRYASDAPPIPTRYPQRLSIFRSPTLATAFVGTGKLGCLGAFLMGCLFVAPTVYQDPESPSWLPPVIMIASAFPLFTVHLLTKPFIVNIFIDTPTVARRSKESLVAFARRLPPDTRLDIETLAFFPLPRTTGLRLSELRIRPQSFVRLANLERYPAVRPESIWSRLAGTSLNHFYARPIEKYWKRSRAPEVWPLVMEHIGKNTFQALTSKPSRPMTAARPSWGRVEQKPASPPAAALRKRQQPSRKK